MVKPGCRLRSEASTSHDREACVRRALTALLAASVLSPAGAAQDDKEFEHRRAQAERMRAAAFANLKEGGPLAPLEWRRNAAGDLEFKPVDETDAKFTPWFGKGIAEAVNATGFVGMVMVPAHNGDVLSLTDAERHLRRLGIVSTTAELAKFVRSPLPERLRDVALLDRMVAVDLLGRRGDDEAKAARTAIAVDATLNAALRERAAARTTARRGLDAATLALPAHCDLVVVCNHANMIDALPLVEIGHFTGLVASLQVIRMLKMPRVSDFVIGQTESEFVTGLPFEIARRLGNFRLDQTVVAIGSADAGPRGRLFVASAGVFSPAAVVAGAPALGVDGVEARLVSGAATATIGGTDLVVTDSLAVAKAPGTSAAPNPELVRPLLGGDAALRVHLPRGSSLLSWLESAGLHGVESADLTAWNADPVVVELVLRAKDDPTATALRARIDELEEIGARALQPELARIIGLGEAPAPKITVKDGVVTMRSEAARAGMTDRLAAWRRSVLEGIESPREAR